MPDLPPCVRADTIVLDEKALRGHKLPIRLPAGQNVTIVSNDENLRTLDLGRAPSLLHLEPGSSLNFVRIHLQGARRVAAVGLPARPWACRHGSSCSALAAATCAEARVRPGAAAGSP